MPELPTGTVTFLFTDVEARASTSARADRDSLSTSGIFPPTAADEERPAGSLRARAGAYRVQVSSRESKPSPAGESGERRSPDLLGQAERSDRDGS